MTDVTFPYRPPIKNSMNKNLNGKEKIIIIIKTIFTEEDSVILFGSQGGSQ